MGKSITTEIEDRYGQPLWGLLHRLYWEEHHSTTAIAEILGVGATAIRKWMAKCGIPRRELGDAQKVISLTGRRPPAKPTGLTGSKNPTWKGGRTQHTKGYVYAFAPWHPDQSNGYVLEHRLMAEQMLGRRLQPDEDVHHKDGDKANNSPDNLEVILHSDHTRRHWAMGRVKTSVA